MAIMNSSKYPQRSSFISCATGGTSFNHTSFFNPSETTSSFSSASSAGSSTSSPIINEPMTTFADPVQSVVPSPPSKRGRKRTKFADPSRIRRPMNSFIHFRRQWVEKHRDSELAKGPKSLSKLAGEAWHSLSKEEQGQFQILATVSKKEHEKRYPHYKYEPKRKISASVGAESQRSSSAERDPDWVPSILRRHTSSVSATSSELSYPSTDDSDGEYLNASYSRGSSVDLSYTPDGESSGFVPQPFPFIVPSKDDRTPTQADFAYSYHNTQALLQDQHMSSPFPNNDFGAASNAQDLALSQSSSQSAYPYYHNLPLQQVAQTLTLPLSTGPQSLMLSEVPTSSQGSETLAYYDASGYVPQMSPDTSSNPAQWEQLPISNESIYAPTLILDNSSQFTSTESAGASTAPYSDYLNRSNDSLDLGFPITPLTRLYFEQEKRNGSSPSTTLEELQNSFLSSLDPASISPSPTNSASPSPPPSELRHPPYYWAETVQDVYENVAEWNMASQ